MDEIKFTGNTIFKNRFLTKILSDGMPFYNRFSSPFEDVYCKWEVEEVILVETLGGLKGEYVFKATPSG